MPCYSNIQTVLIDLDVVKSVAESMGISVIMKRPNRYTLKTGREHIDIERTEAGQKFNTVAFSGSDNWENEILQPLVMGYAKAQLKAFAKKSGYTLSAGSKSGEYIFTSYK
jgi:hypothetical protein